MDPQQQLILKTAYQAVESSGHLGSHHRADGDKVGVFLGASFRDHVEHTATHPASAYTATTTIGAFLGEKKPHYFGWSGPAEVIDTACSASAVDIKNASRAIQHGECLIGDIGDKSLWSEILSIEKPLGLDSSRSVFLSLDCDEEGQSFTYKVQSNLKQNVKEKATLCGQGRFSFLTQEKMSRQWSIMRDQRMVESQMRELLANSKKDTLKHGQIYNLFGRVIDYKDVLQGIDIISFS